ncbi:MAG: hypothetical protein ACFB9N_00255 [Geitlerinemataceae cyanobacterium]
MRLRQLTAGIGLVAAIALSGAPAQANEFEEQVATRIYEMADGLRLMEDAILVETVIETLEADETVRLNFTMNAGQDYTIIGACDSDCSDIDFELFDSLDFSVAEDFGTDGLPIIRVTPDFTEEFSLDVSMFDCTSGFCYYGVSVFRQNDI